MTEIPEHLLKRSRERKAALGDGPPPEESTPAAEVTPATSAAPAVSAAAVAEIAPEPEPPARVAAYVEAAQTRKKMPYWIVPVLLVLPFWAMMYVGTLERVPQGLTGLLGEGESLYVEAGCSGCHGATGGGGIGPALADGETHVTFTSIEDQIVWIAQGSAIVGTGTNYSSADSTRPRAVSGQMPGFGSEGSTSLTAEQIIAVALYERTQFEPGAQALFDLEIVAVLNELIETGELELPETFDGATLTASEVSAWLEPAIAELRGEGAEVAAGEG